MTAPEISVLLVTHNHADFVEEATESIDAQSVERAIEVVVADDASTDGTAELLEEWASRSRHPVRVLPGEAWLGITANYARGFGACRGRYVATLEGDDRWIDHEKLTVMAATLDRHPECALAVNRSVLQHPDGSAFAHSTVCLDAPAATFSADDLAESNFVGTFSACTYRRELLERLRPEVFATTAYDWLVNLALTEFGPIAFVPRAMTLYRIHGRGAWSSIGDEARRAQLLTSIPEYDAILGGRVSRSLSRHRQRIVMELRDRDRAETPSPAPEPVPQAIPTLLRRDRPRVSVVMAAHDHEDFVEYAIDSVLKQSFADLELVVVDDGSSDSTPKRVASIDDPRLRLYRLPTNHGAAAAMNLALQQTTADLVAVINSDDAWEPTKLERQLEVLEHAPELAAVFTAARLISETGEPLSPTELPVWHDIFRQPNRSQARWLRHFFELGNCLCHPSALVRRSVYETIGFYDNRLRQLPDFDRWIRLAKRFPFAVLGDEQLVRYRVLRQDRNTSSPSPPNVARTVFEHLELCRSFFTDFDPDMFRDAFGDLFVDPMSSTDEELACEQALLWINTQTPFGPIYRFHGVTELYRLLERPRERDLLGSRYGIDDLVLHDLSARLADDAERQTLDPGDWLAPAFGPRDLATLASSGEIARELVERAAHTPLWRWPARIAHHARKMTRRTDR